MDQNFSRYAGITILGLGGAALAHFWAQTSVQWFGAPIDYNGTDTTAVRQKNDRIYYSVLTLLLTVIIILIIKNKP